MRIPRPSNFVLGLLLGVVLGASGTATAAVLTPRIVGGDGYLLTWDITNQDGETLCSDPFVWTGTKEIECELED